MTFYGALIDDEGDYEDIMATNQNVPFLSFLDAESSFDVLRNYYEGLKFLTETRFLIDQFAQHIQAHRLSIPKKGPKIDILFGRKPKPI